MPAKEHKPNDDETEPSVASRAGGYAVASLPPRAVTLPPRELHAWLANEIDPVESHNPAARAARLYFGSVPVGRNIGPIERWPGEEPVLLTPPSSDPDIKQSALAPLPEDKPGQTIAPKGEVTGPGQRPKTPAERLGLTPRNAPRPRNAWPRRSISNPAARPSAARSRSRRW